jgi:hypothetical protein
VLFFQGWAHLILYGEESTLLKQRLGLGFVASFEEEKLKAAMDPLSNPKHNSMTQQSRRQEGEKRKIATPPYLSDSPWAVATMNEGKEKGLPDGWTVFYDVRKKKKNNRAVTTIALFPQAFKLFAGSTKTQKMDRSQWPSRWFDS